MEPRSLCTSSSTLGFIPSPEQRPELVIDGDATSRHHDAPSSPNLEYASDVQDSEHLFLVDADTSDNEEQSYKNHQDRDEMIENLQRQLRGNTDRDAAILTLAQLLSLTNDLEELEDSIYENYLTLCMPRAAELQTLTNSELVRTFGRVAHLSPRLTVENHAGTLQWLNNNAGHLMDRLDVRDNLLALNKAKIYLHRALSLAPAGHQIRPRIYNNLGSLHKLIFRREGELADIEQALAYQIQAIQSVSPEDGLLPKYLLNLGNIYSARFVRLGKLEDGEQSITHQHQALSLAAKTNDIEPEIYAGLGNAYEARYNRLGDLVDLNNAIDNHELAIALVDEFGDNKTGYLCNLGGVYRLRFDRLGNLADADRAIDTLLQAVDFSLDLDAAMYTCLSNLGDAYRSRFLFLGTLTDINESISHYMQALPLISKKHALKPLLLFKISEAFASRFEYLGEVEDIDNAVAYQTQSLHLTPDDDEHRPSRLDGLGGSYEARFERLGEIADIDRAIMHRNIAVSITPEDDKDLTVRLSGLSSSYTTRFERTGELRDINEAVAHLLRAVSIVPKGRTDRPIYLDCLGRAYMLRYQAIKDPRDIEIAITYQAQAISLAVEGDINKTHWLNNICISYLYRFECNGQIDDIDRAIESISLAGSLLPEDHMGHLLQLSNLGSAYKLRFGRLGEANDCAQSIEAFRHAALLSTGRPSFRLDAACEWAKISADQKLPYALEAYQRIMELIPQVVWLGTSPHYQYKDISDLGDIVTEAAMTAIELEIYDLALEWLEQGRFLLWRQTLQLRTPLDDLRHVDPRLANRLQEVARAIEQASTYIPGSVSTPKQTLGVPSSEKAGQRRRRLAEEWQSLLDTARGSLGAEDPFTPKRTEQLLNAAHSGPVVILNVHTYRCDALVLEPNSASVAHVPLLSLSREKIVDAQHQLLLSLQGTGVRSRQERSPLFFYPDSMPNMFKGVLGFLWSDIAEPILKHLGYTYQTRMDELPHLTWCTTGALAFLPLHAAGLYDDPNPQSKIFNYVISSYTPTLSALLVPPSPHNFQGILAVGQANIGASNALPATITELANIKKRAGQLPMTQLDEENATPDAVLQAMQSHNWVHLACHAAQNADDPTKSAFCLHGGTLDLARITAYHKPGRAEFAFLSACETASGDKTMPDEAVHLAAGMLVVGFRSVVATMWSINDNDAPLVADQVYAHLLEDGVPDSAKAAKALHMAVQSLRDKIGEKQFAAWVPFIHMGL